MILVALFFLGLFFGSFANVVSLRINSGKKGIFLGNSVCPKCNHKLKFFELIPVFSFLFLGGKCRKCKTKISWQYPAVEIFFGLLFLSVGFFSTPIFVTPENFYFFLWRLLILFFLGILVISDLRFFEIPDQISLPLIFILLIFSIVSTFFYNITGIPKILDGLLGTLIVVGFFLFLIVISKGRWLGGGDLRLGAILGLSLGAKISFLCLFLSYFLGTIVMIPFLLFGKKSRNSMVPFGPFLAAGNFIGLFFGQEILQFYLNLIGLSVN